MIIKRRLRFVHKGKKEEGTVIKGKRENRNKGRGRTSHKWE